MFGQTMMSASKRLKVDIKLVRVLSGDKCDLGRDLDEDEDQFVRVSQTLRKADDPKLECCIALLAQKPKESVDDVDKKVCFYVSNVLCCKAKH